MRQLPKPRGKKIINRRAHPNKKAVKLLNKFKKEVAIYVGPEAEKVLLEGFAERIE
jgi:hypothetical protein